MAKQIRIPTKHVNIFSYETNNGTRYNVRKKYKDSSGKLYSIDKSGFRKIHEAVSFLSEVNMTIVNNQTGLLSNKKITVSEWFEIFKKKKVDSKEWTNDSLQSYNATYNSFIKEKFGTMPISMIDRVIYQDHINIFLKKYAQESVKSFHNHFMAILNDAYYSEVIDRNRLKRIVIRGDDKPKNKSLETKDYFKFMAEAKNEIILNYAMIYLASRGLRRGEILGVQSDNFLYTNKEKTLSKLKVISTRTNKSPNGKGTKTASSERYVFFDNEGTLIMEKAINEAREIKSDFGRILHKNDFIFINATSGKPFSIPHLNVVMKRISSRCNVKVNPHMLRHYFASTASMAGISKRVTADLLGHKNESTTDIYIHSTKESIEDSSVLINKLLSNQ